MRSVWSDLDAIDRQLARRKKQLLILDFDGTLAGIVKSPHRARLAAGTRRVLLRLGRRRHLQLAFVSGRSLADLKRRVRVPGAVYAGNHGLEFSGHRLRLPERAIRAKRLGALIWLLGKKLKEDLVNVPGILIEDKNYTLSLHYRNVPREYRPFLEQEVRRFRRKYAHWPLIWRQGKKVWEVRPGVQWDKGDALLHLMRMYPGYYPTAVGDDHTDEDMFRAVEGKGLGVRVGRSLSSRATHYLRSTKDVQRWMEHLCRL